MDLDYIVNPITSTLTLASILFLFLLAAVYVIHPQRLRPYTAYALPALFALSLAGTLGSLFYSEILGYLPCNLCWWQRIFLFPQIVILALALVMKDTRVLPYSLVLSGIGALIAFYHILLQWGLAPKAGCAAVGGPDCAARVIVGYGFVTIPLMALTGFLLLGAIALVARRLE